VRYPPSFIKILLVASLLLPVASVAQSISTIVTDHFRIAYLPGTEGTARRVAEVAEEVFPGMAAAYNYYEQVSPIHVLVIDSSDQLGNGAADYYSNTIYIWATNLDTELRGSHDWIKNVFTHELAHIMTLNMARKKWPFQFALFSVSRFDSNPDITFNFPLYHLNTPTWWSEGIAQYATYQYGYDQWDTHRDMVLRMGVLEDDMLSYEEMGNLRDRTGAFYGEMVYNQGYSFLLYMQAQYGREKVEELTHHVGSLSFDPAIRTVLGVSADQLYDDWRHYLKDQYGRLAAEVRREGFFEGEYMQELNEGILEYHPALSPNGSKIAYITSRKYDYAIPNLVIYDFDSRKKKVFKGSIDSRVSWSPDGKELVFVRNKGGFNDLYIYNLERNKERRISSHLRAKDPSFAPDGERIVYIHNEDGTNNIGLINKDGTDRGYLTNNDDATQYSGPRFSPDGKQIVFSIFHGEDRDIAVMRADSPQRSKEWGIRDRTMIPDSLKIFPDSLAFPDPDTSGFKALIASRADERDPAWLADGSGLVYASDQSGIFNLYHYDLVSGAVEQLTNVVGGAFVPTVGAEGRIIYSGYHSSDYNLYSFQLGAFQKEAVFEPVALRDYQTIIKKPKLSDEYTISRYGGRRIINYIPILSVGPTLVGNAFGLNQVSGGLQFSVGEALGSEQLTAWAVAGKNVRDATDFNTDFGVSYERSLFPLNGNNRNFNPNFFLGYRRREIDNLLQSQTTVQQDTIPAVDLIAQIDSVNQILLPNTEQYITQVDARDDLFKSRYVTFSAGIELPLTRRQQFFASYSYRDYEESWTLKSVQRQSNVFLVQDGKDITAILPADQTSLKQSIIDETSSLDFYRGLDFYNSHDFTVAWTYRFAKPTADGSINPTGRALSLIYRYMAPTLTDSLASLAAPVGAVPSDAFGSVDRSFRVNEYVGAYTERIGLPYYNTLAFQFVGAYRNAGLKDTFIQDGGFFEGRFYWPLRYYLGGQNFMSGYPYFSIWGSKLAYGRVAYQFPLLRRISKRFLNFTFSKLYATLFYEVGAVSNKQDFNRHDFSTKPWLTDVGAEVRMQFFTFYRLPMNVYFQVARPLNRDRVDDQIDKYRYYFGFGI